MAATKKTWDDVAQNLVLPVVSVLFSAIVAAVALAEGGWGLWFALFIAFMNLRSIARDVAAIRERFEETHPPTNVRL